MKIGVFGDSFVEHRTPYNIWWKYLDSTYGHTVECFGESGSSLIFSARKILDRYQNYDLVIWCVTTSNRLTVWHRANFKDIAIHVTGRHHQRHADPEIQQKINIAEQYINHVFDWQDGEFSGHCVIKTVQATVPNLLIVPSFPTPVYPDIENAGFNLFDLYQQETTTYFPDGREIAVIQDQYNDKRAGHFTDQTHQILAQLISQSLQPGIFSTSYKNFPPPTELFDSIFEKL